VTIAAGLGLAFIFGLIASRFKLPPLLGYLVAGLAIGPFTPGLVADTGLAQQLSEIGVSLLMFGVGLHFSIKDLWSVRKVAIPGAVVQIAVATGLGALLAKSWGWGWGAGLVFGLCLSVASTVVLLRAMTERGQLETVDGRIAVGWLIVEDLATVVALVALPALVVHLGGEPTAGDAGGNIWLTLLFTLAKVTVFVAAMLVLGKKLIPRILGKVARTGNRELFTLGVTAVALGIAFGAAELFGVSPALGAFFAGVVISESDLSHQASAEILPLQETFTVLFFVSVGMMFDPAILVQQPVAILMTLLVVMVGKSIAAGAIVLLFRFPVATAITISASLAQIGEFSFILVSLGISLKLLPASALSILLAVAIVSIALNPAIFASLAVWNRFMTAHPRLKRLLEGRMREYEVLMDEDSRDLEGHVVMIGYGRVGATIGKALSAREIPYVVVDLDRAIVEELQKQGVPTIFGDASRPGMLRHVGLSEARLLVIATPAKSQVRAMVEAARKINPQIEICVRTHSGSDSAYFEEMGIQRVVMGELELALEMADFALKSYIVPRAEADEIIADLRDAGAAALSRKAP
jgi:CPA2 family monovalent cation:H+ antiporter-2